MAIALPLCLQAALAYRQRGWSALALCPPDHRGVSSQHTQLCQRPGKTPLWTWKAYQDRLPKEPELRTYWSRNPYANVGIALGPVSQLVGLDIDGTAGETLLHQLSSGISSPTLEFSTPSGGRRLLYRISASLNLPNRSWCPGSEPHAELRLLAYGRQTVMPPSPGYEWITGHRPGEIEPADCPDWILKLLTSPEAPSDDQGVGGAVHLNGSSHSATPLERARAYLAQCDPAISGQHGHNQTFKIACKLLHGFHLSAEIVFDLLDHEYNPRCIPPWSKKELLHKVQEAASKGHAPDLLTMTTPPLPPPLVVSCTTAATLTRRSVEWLWPGWIPLGKMCMLDGDPDLGKSTVLMDLAARVSSHAVMPNGVQGISGDVLILSAEDDAEDTILPRLDAAGADLDRCHFLTEIQGVPPSIPQHLPEIRQQLQTHQVRLLIIDPLTAYLDADACSDQKVRRALHPLKLILQEQRTASVSLRHLNKGAGTKAIYRGGGSIAIIGAARAGMLVAIDPDDPEQRILAQTKHNLSDEQMSLRYRLQWSDLDQACRVIWIPGSCSYRADELLQMQCEDKEVKTMKQEAIEFLQTFLADGPKPAAEVYAQAKEHKITDTTTLKHAKSALNITSKPIKGADGKLLGWIWSLPESNPHPGHSGNPELT